MPNEHQQIMTMQQKVLDIQHWFMDLLTALAAKNKMDHVKDKATEKLIRHMQKGGKCSCLSFPLDDIKFVEEMLKKEGILAIEMDSVNPETSRTMRTYVFREQDLKKVQKIADEYIRHMDGKCHELDMDTFMLSNQDRSYFSATGLSEIEMNIFRENALKYDMDYIFVKNNTITDGAPYQVMANNKEALDKCLIDTYADLVGQDGRDFKAKMEKMWDDQVAMIDKFKSSKEPVFIVDADNMNSVIEVTAGFENKDGERVGKRYRTHHLAIRKEQDPRKKGAYIRVPVDEGITIDRNLDLDILQDLRCMSKPVVLTAEEAQRWLNYKDRDRDDKTLLLPELFANAEERTKFINETLQSREILPTVRPLHAREERAKDGMKTYTDLPYSIIRSLRAEKIDGLYILGNDVAFTKEAEEKVRNVMERDYYNGMKTLDVISHELRFMGRGAGRLHDLDKNEGYFVYDFADPSKVIEITDTKAIMRDGREEVDLVASDYPVYEQKMTEFIAGMKTPIIMSKEEYNDPNERSRLAFSMVMSPRENVAVVNAKLKDKEKLERFYENAEKADKGVISKEDQFLSDDERALLQRRERSKVVTHEEHTVEKVFEDKNIIVERDRRYREEQER